jgi:hypothetical protein
MATTTPNYGWTVPTSTDLVKDGATAIETLGDAIDASMNTALGTKKAGMVLLNTTSFSGVASQDITGVFSATYDQYRINFNVIGTGASNRDLNFRYLSGTTPNTSAVYRRQEWGAQSTSVFANRATGQTSNRAGLCQNTTPFTIILDIFFPFSSTARTQFQTYSSADVTANVDINQQFGSIDVTTSYDGIQFFPSADNMTGSISVYGYNK